MSWKKISRNLKLNSIANPRHLEWLHRILGFEEACSNFTGAECCNGRCSCPLLTCSAGPFTSAVWHKKSASCTAPNFVSNVKIGSSGPFHAELCTPSVHWNSIKFCSSPGMQFILNQDCYWDSHTHSLSKISSKMHISGYTNKWEMSADGGFRKMQSKNNYLKSHNEVFQWVYDSGELKMIFLPLKILSMLLIKR